MVSRKTFVLDQVFGKSTTQNTFFENCGLLRLIDSALDGYSTTVFAYGQTGSGKTHTISGVEKVIMKGILDDPDSCGLIPRALFYISSQMEEINRNQKDGRSVNMKAGYLEIYNEQVRDLLNTDSGWLDIRWNTEQGFYVEG
eukprot:776852_1